jgi:hypothetical protein
MNQPYAMLARRWIRDGMHTAWMDAWKAAKAADATMTEEERVRLLCEEVEQLNREIPVNNGKPAITGEAFSPGRLLS